MHIDDRDVRLAWFRDARVGMFVHWGCYSVAGRGEQVLNRDMMPLAEYTQLAERFKPDPDWAPRLAGRARAMGAKYVAMTTRHHDGYCLFDTKTDPFNAVNTGPGRDLVQEFADAVRAEGLKVGFYYSVLNWRWRGFWDPEAHPADLPRMVEEVHNQAEELMTHYGRIDVLWYDGCVTPGSITPGAFGYDGHPVEQDRGAFYRAEELNARVRALQPHILINNRSGVPEDFGTPEQELRVEDDAKRAWELCQTLNYAPGWGYIHRSLANKSFGEVVYNMIKAVRLGGNYLFNVGPDARGRIDARQGEIVDRLGVWLERHGEAVYGTRPEGIYEGASQGACYHYGMFTCRGATAYLTLFYYPPDPLVISRLGPAIRSAELLTTGQTLEVEPVSNARWRINGLPEEPPQPSPPVVKLQFEAPPYLLHYRGAEWLDGDCSPDS